MGGGRVGGWVGGEFCGSRQGGARAHTRAQQCSRAREGSRLRLTLAQIEVNVLQTARELHQPRPCRRGKGEMVQVWKGESQSQQTW